MSSPREHTILIGVGSNIEPRRNIAKALQHLRREFNHLAISTLYRTRPLNGRDQPPYVNGVVAARTSTSLAAVRQRLAVIETACGRKRNTADTYASRTLDLDLLIYNDLDREEEDLPAADLTERDFCLIPAAELLPNWMHPRLRDTLEHLARTYFPDPPNILESIPLSALIPPLTRPDSAQPHPAHDGADSDEAGFPGK